MDFNPTLERLSVTAEDSGGEYFFDFKYILFFLKMSSLDANNTLWHMFDFFEEFHSLLQFLGSRGVFMYFPDSPNTDLAVLDISWKARFERDLQQESWSVSPNNFQMFWRVSRQVEIKQKAVPFF